MNPWLPGQLAATRDEADSEEAEAEQRHRRRFWNGGKRCVAAGATTRTDGNSNANRQEIRRRDGTKPVSVQSITHGPMISPGTPGGVNTDGKVPAYAVAVPPPLDALASR